MKRGGNTLQRNFECEGMVIWWKMDTSFTHNMQKCENSLI